MATLLPDQERGAAPGHLASPFAATAYFCAPDASAFEMDALVTTDGNRWSSPGEPTIYLAGDAGVALAEYGRHATTTDSGDVHIWRVNLALDAALDLRNEEARSMLGFAADPGWFLDSNRCRSLARRLRAGRSVDGLIVPSVAMLDQPSRWNAVVFVDRLRNGPFVAIRPLGLLGELRLAMPRARSLEPGRLIKQEG